MTAAVAFSALTTRLLGLTIDDKSIRTISTVDGLVCSSNVSSQVHGAECVQELAREFLQVVLRLGWVERLVDMLEPPSSSEAASAAALALAAIASRPEGRRAVRAAGGIPPLAALLGEGLDSSPAASAALALASCAVDDECKAAVYQCAWPHMLSLFSAALSRAIESKRTAQTYARIRAPASTTQTSTATAGAGTASSDADDEHASSQHQQAAQIQTQALVQQHPPQPGRLVLKPSAGGYGSMAPVQEGPGASLAATYAGGILVNLVQNEVYQAKIKQDPAALHLLSQLAAAAPPNTANTTIMPIVTKPSQISSSTAGIRSSNSVAADPLSTRAAFALTWLAAAGMQLAPAAGSEQQQAGQQAASGGIGDGQLHGIRAAAGKLGISFGLQDCASLIHPSALPLSYDQHQPAARTRHSYAGPFQPSHAHRSGASGSSGRVAIPDVTRGVRSISSMGTGAAGGGGAGAGAGGKTLGGPAAAAAHGLPTGLLTMPMHPFSPSAASPSPSHQVKGQQAVSSSTGPRPPQTCVLVSLDRPGESPRGQAAAAGGPGQWHV